MKVHETVDQQSAWGLNGTKATTKLPHISPAEAATHAACNLTEALQNLPPNASFAPVGDKQLTAIKELAVNFQKAITPVLSQALKKSQVSPRVEVTSTI
eukprot:15367048-Ditylum_brightwellii.AAC.1